MNNKKINLVHVDSYRDSGTTSWVEENNPDSPTYYLYFKDRELYDRYPANIGAKLLDKDQFNFIGFNVQSSTSDFLR